MRERAEPSKAVFSLGGLSVQELARWVVREFQQLECPALACDRRAADRLHGPRLLPRPGCRAAVAMNYPRSVVAVLGWLLTSPGVFVLCHSIWVL